MIEKHFENFKMVSKMARRIREKRWHQQLPYWCIVLKKSVLVVKNVNSNNAICTCNTYSN